MMSEAVTKHYLASDINPMIPQWIMKICDHYMPHEYQNEGMTRHYIYSNSFSHLEEGQYQHVKKALDHLLDLYMKKVDFSLMFETFKIVNALVANPLSKSIFDFKIKAIYGIFQDYPAVIFDRSVCKELATLAPFFPSAHDIKKVLGQKKTALEQQISILKSLIKKSKGQKGKVLPVIQTVDNPMSSMENDIHHRIQNSMSKVDQLLKKNRSYPFCTMPNCGIKTIRNYLVIFINDKQY